MQFWYHGQAVERLGQRYRLEGQLGSGGMAQVCLAWDEREKRRVAVKILQASDLDQETLNRFMQEASQIVYWRHPHILHVYDAMQIELLDPAHGVPLFYFVMEYAAGGDLHRRLTPGSPFPLAATFALFHQLCDAVQFAHEHGVIHRDLKPLNILFRRPATGPEVAVLSDFGLAVRADASHFTFARGGTLAYMAPEQFAGDISPACDIFALGVILYQLGTGRLPFQRRLADLAHVQQAPLPQAPSLLNPDFPSALDASVLRALQARPARRYPSVQAFWQTIEQTLIVLAQTSPFSSHESWRQTLEGRQSEQLSEQLAVQEMGAGASELDQVHSEQVEVDLPETRSRVPRRASAYLARTGLPTSVPAPRIITFHPAAGTQPGEAHGSRERATHLPAPTGQRRAFPFSHRLVLLALAGLLVVVLLATSLPGSPLRLAGVSPTVVTITPRARLEQLTAHFTAVTGTPDPVLRQIQARTLAITTPAQSTIATATGALPAARASGQLTFINNTANTIVVQSGMVTGNSGISVAFTGPITIPAIPPTVVVAGIAVNPGATGNIPAFDIDTVCCVSGVVVKNTQAFTGGHDSASVVQQSDITGAAKGLSETLTRRGQASLQGQVQSTERLVEGSVLCQSHVSADHRAGESARTVMISVIVTCDAEVYDDQALRQAADHLLRAQAAGDPNLGSAYALAGALHVSIRSLQILSPLGDIDIAAQAQGVWAYTFPQALLHQWATRLAGDTRARAQDFLLHQAGIVAVRFRSDAALPASSDQIQLVVGLPAESS